MKTKQSCEQSFQGCIKNARKHARAVLELLDEIDHDPELNPEVVIPELREAAQNVVLFVHGLNAYHNVLFTK